MPPPTDRHLDQAVEGVVGAWIPDEIVMRYVDDELPWSWRIPVRVGVILSPQLRRRVRGWRKLSTDVQALRR